MPNLRSGSSSSEPGITRTRVASGDILYDPANNSKVSFGDATLTVVSATGLIGISVIKEVVAYSGYVDKERPIVGPNLINGKIVVEVPILASGVAEFDRALFTGATQKVLKLLFPTRPEADAFIGHLKD